MAGDKILGYGGRLHRDGIAVRLGYLPRAGRWRRRAMIVLTGGQAPPRATRSRRWE